MKRFIALILILLSAGTASAAPAEVNGIFLTPGHEQLHWRTTPAEQIDALVNYNYNTVYITDPRGEKFKQLLIEAHRRGMLVFVQFTFPIYVSSERDELAQKHRDWFTQTRGVFGIPFFRGGGGYLNPYRHEVQQLLIDQAIRLVGEFDIDGVQLRFDDYQQGLAEIGYDQYTIDAFRAATDLDAADEKNAPSFLQWRADRLGEFALQFVTHLRATNPNLILSTLASVDSKSAPLTNWMSWLRWCECGGKRWDEIAIRFSRDQIVDTEPPLWQDTIEDLQAAEKMFVTIVPSGVDNIAVARNQIAEAGLLGSIVSDGYGIPLPPSIEDGDDPEPILNTHPARHPLKPANWREPSIPATREGDVFVADLKEGNRYHVIVKKDGIWNDIGSFDLKPGRNTFLQEGDALELMIDRRP